jgi:hypothetical protein
MFVCCFLSACVEKKPDIFKELDANIQKQKILVEGEFFYSGSGKLKYCDSVDVQLIFSPVLNQARAISITLNNFKAYPKDIGTQDPQEFKKYTYYDNKNKDVKNGKVTIKLINDSILNLSELGEPMATGSLTFNMSFSNKIPGLTQRDAELLSLPKIFVPLGTTKINLNQSTKMP